MLIARAQGRIQSGIRGDHGHRAVKEPGRSIHFALFHADQIELGLARIDQNFARRVLEIKLASTGARGVMMPRAAAASRVALPFLDLDSATLVAPFDGIIAAINGNPGEQAGSGATNQTTSSTSTSIFVTLIVPSSTRFRSLGHTTDPSLVRSPGFASCVSVQGNYHAARHSPSSRVRRDVPRRCALPTRRIRSWGHSSGARRHCGIVARSCGESRGP